MRCEHCGVEQGRLLTVADIQREYGLKRAAAEQVMRQLPKIVVPGLRRVYVRRDLLDSRLSQWSVR